MLNKNNKTIWTKSDELKLINETQNDYVLELYKAMQEPIVDDTAIKFINFTSPTGTGKTKMIIKLINMCPDDFFIITTLSRGQLDQQVETSIQKEALYNNYCVYGAMKLTSASKLKEQDIEDLIQNQAKNKKIYWIRDEGHIHTNRWSNVLEKRCYKIINFSATNHDAHGIMCNFAHTTMLRMVNQDVGSPKDAIKKLLQIKKEHMSVSKYNPCAIFRVVSREIELQVIELSKSYGLKYISLVDNDFNIASLCEDDNEFDIIINKQKITEGIDIRRAHVLWIENKPNNVSTIIQAVGRCRRNALLWRNDVDIFDPKNKELLKHTRQCYIYYNVSKSQLNVDQNGEIIMEFCPVITVQKLKPHHIIYVENGKMLNGLTVFELIGCTGEFEIKTDLETGYNIVDNDSFYQTHYSDEFEFVLDWIQNLNRNLSTVKSDFWKNLQKLNAKYIQMHELPKIQYQLSTDKNNIEVLKYNDVVNFHGKLEEKSESLSLFHLKLKMINEEDFFKFNENKPSVLSSKKVIIKQHIDFVKLKCQDNCYILSPKEIDTICSKHYLDIDNFDWESRKTKQSNSCFHFTQQSTLPTSDKFLSIVGVNEFTYHQKGEQWELNRSITDNIIHRTKLSCYIDLQYKEEIDLIKKQLFNCENNFPFDKTCNSCLGYCVEYYSKYLLFGKEYLGDFLLKAQNEFSTTNQDVLVIRACMLKYKFLMASTFGNHIEKVVPTMTIEKLLEPDFDLFVHTVIALGNKTYLFLKQNINVENAKHTDCVLNTKYLCGLMDICDGKTIVDIKCTNTIDMKMVRQVISYYLLSKYKNNLDIDKVIIYDATSGTSIFIKLPTQKTTDEYTYKINNDFYLNEQLFYA